MAGRKQVNTARKGAAKAKATRTTKAADKSIWRAGLGVIAVARREGERLVETIANESAQIRVRADRAATALGGEVRSAAQSAQAQVSAYVAPLRARAGDAAREIEVRVSSGVGSLLGRIGVPSRREVQQLGARVDALTRQVKAVSARKR